MTIQDLIEQLSTYGLETRVVVPGRGREFADPYVEKQYVKQETDVGLGRVYQAATPLTGEYAVLLTRVWR